MYKSQRALTLLFLSCWPIPLHTSIAHRCCSTRLCLEFIQSNPDPRPLHVHAHTFNLLAALFLVLSISSVQVTAGACIETYRSVDLRLNLMFR